MGREAGVLLLLRVVGELAGRGGAVAVTGLQGRVATWHGTGEGCSRILNFMLKKYNKWLRQQKEDRNYFVIVDKKGRKH